MLKIGLDAGHCINTPGKRTPDGIREWSLNSAVCNYIEEYLKGYADILRTDDRTGNSDVSLVSRKTKAINNCDVLISIHHNADKGKWGKATGIETYVHSNYTTDKSNKLATLLADKMSNYTGLRNRGVKNAKFAVIATSKIPAVLCEGGFMDGEHDSYYIRTEEGQRAYARAVSDSIKEYFNLGQVPSNTISNTSGSYENVHTDEKKEIVRKLQHAYNVSYKTNLDEDGVIGPKTTKVMKEHYLKNFTENELARWVQDRLVNHKGYSVGPSGIDGKYGKDTENTIKEFQCDNRLKIDGYAGYNTISILI